MFRKARRFDATRKRQRPFLRRLRKAALFAALVFVIYVALTAFLADSFQVDSVSMRPGYEPGDRLFISPLWYGPRIPFTEGHLPGIFSPRRGDVAVLLPPYAARPSFPKELLGPVAGFFTGRKNASSISFAGGREWENRYVLRRIVALPGDTVRIRAGEAFIRPQGTPDFVSEFSLSLSSYEIIRETLPEDWPEESPLSGPDTDILLGEEEYFVLADNRNGSLDSRLWGPVHEDRIVTKVLLRYWSPGKR
jgi:signal peptidase I